MEQFNVSHGPTNTILIMKKSLCVDILSLEIWGQKAKKQRTSVLDIIYSLPRHTWEIFSARSKFPVILRWEGWTEHKDDSIIVLSWKVIRWSELKWIGPTSPAGEIHESLALTRNHKCTMVLLSKLTFQIAALLIREGFKNKIEIFKGTSYRFLKF